MAINFMHLLGRGPELQSDHICIHLLPAERVSHALRNVQSARRSPVAAVRASMRWFNIHFVDISSWNRCLKLGPSQEPSNCHLQSSANVNARLRYSLVHKFIIWAFFFSFSQWCHVWFLLPCHAPPIRPLCCRRISKLDYLTSRSKQIDFSASNPLSILNLVGKLTGISLIII